MLGIRGRGSSGIWPMIASNGQGSVVVGQALAVALSRAREPVVGLRASALGRDGAGLRLAVRGVIAQGKGR
jgi:hypothetical protein